MINSFIDGTHKFTKISVIIQLVFWINFFLVLIQEYFLRELNQFPLVVDIVNFLVLVMLISPFIGLVLNFISLFLDKRKAFAIVLFSGNIVLIGVIIYLFVSIASSIGVD